MIGRVCADDPGGRGLRCASCTFYAVVRARIVRLHGLCHPHTTLGIGEDAHVTKR